MSETRSKCSAKRPSRVSPAWRKSCSDSSATSHGGRGGGGGGTARGRLSQRRSAKLLRAHQERHGSKADSLLQQRPLFALLARRRVRLGLGVGRARGRILDHDVVRLRAEGDELAARARDRDRIGGNVSSCRPGSLGRATNDSVTRLLVLAPSLRSTLGPAPPSGLGTMKPAVFKALASGASAWK